MSRKRRHYTTRRPVNRAVRGQPLPNKTDAVWYAKLPLSRPLEKQQRAGGEPR